MRTVHLLLVSGMAAATAILAACTGGRGGDWIELATAGDTSQMLQIVGTVHRLEIENGVFVIRDAQGVTYQPTNLPERFRKDGTAVEAVARRSSMQVSIGMAGTLIDLLRIRTRTGGERATATATVTGTVAYRERMAMPPGAVVQIQLADVSRQDVPSRIVAEATVTPDGKQVPIPFELTYDPASVNPDALYSVRATIRDGSDLIFTTTSAYPVITRGNPSRVDLMLRRVPSQTAAAPTLRGTSWILEDLAGRGVLDRVRATLTFSDDDSVSGNASCNQFRSTARVNGDTISFGPLVATGNGCPEAVMQQEQQYLDALRTASRFEINGSLLYIHRLGQQPLRFVAADGR